MSTVMENGRELLLGRADVAAWLSISTRTLDQISRRPFAGRPSLKPVIQTQMCVRYDPAVVRTWLAAGSEPTARRKRGRPRKYRPESTAKAGR